MHDTWYRVIFGPKKARVHLRAYAYVVRCREDAYFVSARIYVCTAA